ncbi:MULTISPECIES: ComEA family DNA-binding protein [Pseudomonas]|uniref:ComEA family DNA-binding protein n=1 Tax=Pseudomonas TaxID=286 RepID=UPI001EFFB469|nr:MULTISPECIES: helix-hairpin-helix domain-containing protein [Pseudomonas]MCG8295061.1 helix-hairpin-helix domain-containing protein [Pseudomonas entomophila]
MRNTVLTYLLLPLLAGWSLSSNAAPVISTDPLPTVSLTTPSIEQMARVDLNQADRETLQRQLSGIGKDKAQAIVEYREANGPFTSVDELLEIKGIGKALLERNRDKMMVE